MNAKKNILLITVDQMRFDHLGLKGVKGIETPNLDRLGREGIHFDRAYTSSPVCTPARLTLLTGQYPSSHGGYSIGVSVDPFPQRTLPAILGENGYKTALIGKAHFVARPHEASHFAGIDKPPLEFFRDHTGPYAGFDFVQMSTNHTTNGKPECHYGAWMEEQGVDYAEWYPNMNGRHDLSQTGVWNIPVQYHDTTWTTDCSREFISKQDGMPWFCWTSYNDPHEPFLCSEPWYSAVRAGEMELYEDYRPGEFDDKPPFYNEVRNEPFGSQVWNDAYINEPGINVPCTSRRRDLDGKEREALQATLGMVAMLDHEVGRIFQTLEKTGQLDNTLVVFTTDHGELMKHHGFWHKGLFAYDDCQRIPFLVWGAGVKQKGTSQALVNLVDLPKTFLDLAGIPVPQGMQGESLLPILTGEKESVQDATMIELQATKKIYQQTLVTDRYKLVLYRDHDWGELYDMQNDPDQYSNLWKKPEFAEVKTELLQKFVQFEMKKEGHVHNRVSFG
jgi:arylsulfatase A-like enzyme